MQGRDTEEIILEIIFETWRAESGRTVIFITSSILQIHWSFNLKFV